MLPGDDNVTHPLRHEQASRTQIVRRQLTAFFYRQTHGVANSAGGVASNVGTGINASDAVSKTVMSRHFPGRPPSRGLCSPGSWQHMECSIRCRPPQVRPARPVRQQGAGTWRICGGGRTRGVHSLLIDRRRGQAPIMFACMARRTPPDTMVRAVTARPL